MKQVSESSVTRTMLARVNSVMAATLLTAGCRRPNRIRIDMTRTLQAEAR